MKQTFPEPLVFVSSSLVGADDTSSMRCVPHLPGIHSLVEKMSAEREKFNNKTPDSTADQTSSPEAQEMEKLAQPEKLGTKGSQEHNLSWILKNICNFLKQIKKRK